MPRYLIGGREFDPADEDFLAALAHAQAQRERPLCLCLVGGVEMVVARWNGTYVLRRMPYGGCRHAPDCLSYEPPAELSGLGQVLGTAVVEDPERGTTMLRLGFAMSRVGSNTTRLPTAAAGDASRPSVVSDGTKLSLRALLHLLWERAELTRWRPGFAGCRSWSTVRHRLLQAADGMIARGRALRERLYVPEPFSVDERDAITARRLEVFLRLLAAPRGARSLMLVVAELKEVAPTRYGCKALLKHVPDQPFVLDRQLFGRMERRFADELALWGSAEGIRMMVVGTFAVSHCGIPTLEELSLMPVTGQWIPVENEFELQLVERLVREKRSFQKGLRYNLLPGEPSVSIVLTDTGELPVSMHIALPGAHDTETDDGSARTNTWIWSVGSGSMPAIPVPGLRAVESGTSHPDHSLVPSGASQALS